MMADRKAALIAASATIVRQAVEAFNRRPAKLEWWVNLEGWGNELTEEQWEAMLNRLLTVLQTQPQVAPTIPLVVTVALPFEVCPGFAEHQVPTGYEVSLGWLATQPEFGRWRLS